MRVRTLKLPNSFAGYPQKKKGGGQDMETGQSAFTNANELGLARNQVGLEANPLAGF